MPITPNDIANLCAIFSELNIRHISYIDLIKKVNDTLTLNSSSSADEIINESLNNGVLTLNKSNNNVVVSNVGRIIGKKQQLVKNIIHAEASEEILKNIYLNLENDSNCAEFLLRLNVDYEQETFVYERSNYETKQDLYWLKNLSKVGFIINKNDKFYVDKKYLEIVNTKLSILRGAKEILGIYSSDDNTQVGNFAEGLAIEYEKQRLKKSGYPELIKLIEHTSKVDQSAGYDIKSCCCDNDNPESPVYIEVKGTQLDYIRFIWSKNERKKASEKSQKYWLYLFKNIDIEKNYGYGPIIIKDAIKIMTDTEYNIEPIDVLIIKK